MRILLIDADSVIPNLALCKLNAFHKSQGDSVDFRRLGLSYFPTKKNKHVTIETGEYDKVYCSVVFQGTIEYIHGDNIIFGGTGFDVTTVLPPEVESFRPDYSIYPENDSSYGFISRGCIRKCTFCFVPKKEGKIRQVDTIGNIIQHKKVRFLDNNILALPNHLEILQELVDRKLHCQFNQGMDIRLLTPESSALISKLNYLGDIIFAFDDWSYLPLIEEKIKLLKWRRPFRIKFYVYTNPKDHVSNLVKRIEWLRKRKFLPYVMRDITCWSSENSDFYVDVAAWANQPSFFKNMSFEEFLIKRHRERGKPNEARIKKSRSLYREGKK